MAHSNRSPPKDPLCLEGAPLVRQGSSNNNNPSNNPSSRREDCSATHSNNLSNNSSRPNRRGRCSTPLARTKTRTSPHNRHLPAEYLDNHSSNQPVRYSAAQAHNPAAVYSVAVRRKRAQEGVCLGELTPKPVQEEASLEERPIPPTQQRTRITPLPADSSDSPRHLHSAEASETRR